MWIERSLSAQLLGLAHTFPAVLLTGARQTGKTALFTHLFPQAAFVSLDLPSVAQYAEETPQEFLRQYPQPLILDEIQYAAGIFRYLKRAIDERRHERSSDAPTIQN
jgi:predicted AAA+ superfamily ATPase